MEGDDVQVKKSRREGTPAASSSSASSSAAAGVDSDEERQRRAERESNFRQQITDMPGLLSIVMAFLPIHLLMQLQLPPLTWQHAARKQHHLTISAADQHERSFWQTATIDLVKEWATYLRQLTSIVLRYPLGFPRWCLDVFLAMVEGHIAGRRAANMGGGTLQSITIEEGVRVTDLELRTVLRIYPSLPPRLDPPPTLHALTTIEGLHRDHQGLADRRWEMPSLTTAQQRNWDAGRLGQFISSSRSLRCVDGSFGGEVWPRVLEGIPAAPAGQPGRPLAQLESIGTIEIDWHDHREVLVARGCRQSLEQLHVCFYGTHVGRRNLPVLVALDRLVGTCCRQDAPLILTTATLGHTEFDLSIFDSADFPSHPSPSFKTMLQQLARQALRVQYILTQDGLADPHANASELAIDIASSLSFDKAETVEVKNADDFDPPTNTPSPHPTIITHLKPFPKASRLHVWSDLAVAAARLFAAKMPEEVLVVCAYGVLGGDEQVGVLTALGGQREVRYVVMGDVGVDQLVGAVGSLPTISGLRFATTLPADVQDAGSFVRARLSSVIPHIRGLQSVTLQVKETTAGQHDSILASLPVGANIGAFCSRAISGSDGGWTVVTAIRNP
ncbi:unnamed protein product [Vitrella brassicaformis CCMP3155]|uniref:Uncharacterized protein n=1 Tax=Vitrella brassicaformis (strain CCMP3155) TaxID=1169540 RepID=A0A0G4FJY5_VITBC|nr:unnamed protein product [Vitrella brassicaformis CCMP3155]|eukprot:CEM14023.1 unnamed protein product [Vitrella brassicaformis CCMP3155]